MKISTLNREQKVAAPLEKIFEFFSEAQNLNRITPPWLNFQVIDQSDWNLKVGSLIHYKLAWHGISLEWITRIEEWRPPAMFADSQLKGPYRFWHHVHSFEACDEGTIIRDTVKYAVPLGALGSLFAGWLVRRDVDRIFDYRAKRISEILTSEQASTFGVQSAGK